MMLIGSPVGHSGSPDMYNFSFRYHNLDYAYMAFDIKEDQVKAALDAMRLFKMRGCNVTMPCKNEAAKYMDELSPAARIIGAVNTIVNEDGKLIGHITDGIGFVRNLKEHGVDVKGKKMVVLGAGGAATAIQVQCALDGAESISIFNRTILSGQGEVNSGETEIRSASVQGPGILSGRSGETERRDCGSGYSGKRYAGGNEASDDVSQSRYFHVPPRTCSGGCGLQP